MKKLIPTQFRTLKLNLFTENKVKKISNWASWTAAHAAWISMAISPLAMGKEAEAISQKNFQTYIDEAGLNTQTTLGEFFEKTKFYYPASVYNDLKEYVDKNKSLVIQPVKVTSAQATNGEQIPVLTFTDPKGKTYSFQIFGEKDNWAKYNNITFPESDFENIAHFFSRLQSSDIRLRKEGDKLIKEQLKSSSAKSTTNSSATAKSQATTKATSSAASTSAAAIGNEAYKKDFARFEGFPRITPVMWKTLSLKEKAEYIVQMRLLWLNARKVLEAAGQLDPEAQGNAPTSQNLTPDQLIDDKALEQIQKQQSSIENFYRIIFGQEVSAADAKKAATKTGGGTANTARGSKGGPPRKNGANLVTPAAAVGGAPDSDVASTIKAEARLAESAVGVTSGMTDASNCVVAGYISKYTTKNGRKACYLDEALESYKVSANKNSNLNFILEANEECKSTKGESYRACHPVLYSYPKGQPLCVDTADKSPDGFQKATHFIGPCDQGSPLSTASTLKSLSFNNNYSGIEPLEKRIAIIEKDQQADNYKLTKDFLSGYLLKQDIESEKRRKGINSTTLESDFLKEKWSPELDNQLVQIQANFETEINKATLACETGWKDQKNQKNKVYNEKNQKEACDQLHRRWLFTEKFIAKIRQNGCPPNSKYIGSYDEKELVSSVSAKDKTTINKRLVSEDNKLCLCPGVENNVPAKVAIGTLQCPMNPPTVIPVKPGECPDGTVGVNPIASGGAKTPENQKTCQCIKKDVETEMGHQILLVDINKFLKEGRKIEDICKPTAPSCSMPAGIDDFNYSGDVCDCDKGKLVNEGNKWICKKSNLLPWAIGGLIGVGLLAFFMKSRTKGKTSTAPIPPFPNPCPICKPKEECGADCKCVPIKPDLRCLPPMMGMMPNCMCDETKVKCIAGMQVFNRVTCQCDVKPPDLVLICGDGEPAPNSDFSKCNKCSDGSFKTRPIFGRMNGCPDVPPASEGGKGDNKCGNKPCAGGVPAAK